MLEKLVRQSRPARGHEIDGLDRTQCNDVLVATTITHDADRLHRQENSERLAHLIVQIMVAKLLDEDVISELQFPDVVSLDPPGMDGA